MTEPEIIIKVHELIGTKYSDDEDINHHSVENGFNCYSWGSYLFNLAHKEIKYLPDNIKGLRREFIKITKTDGNGQCVLLEPARFLDIPVFYLSDLDTRHVGVMLNPRQFTHCSKSSNGVSISELTRWTVLLRDIYRHV